jgi:hypothetical protein
LIGGKKSARQNTTDLARDSRNGIKMSGFHNAESRSDLSFPNCMFVI